MNFKYVVGGFVAAVLLSACAPVGQEALAESSPTPIQTDSPAETPEPETSAEPEPTPTATSTEGETIATGSDDTSADETALAALVLLAVKGRAPMTGYARSRFGQAWLDADRNGCDTRNDILGELLTDVVLESNGCVVTSGKYDDPYTGDNIDYRYGVGTLIDIDHVVALGNSWATGAERWDIKKRAAFANDPLNLLPADASANRQKGDGDAATWLPAYKPFRCEYVARQVAVKQKYGLWVTAPEQEAITRVLSGCGGQVLTQDAWAVPTRVDHNITDPGAPEKKPVAKPTEKPASPPKVKPLISVYFQNCDAARAAGAAPVHRGDPGYGSHLDRDGDGVGCES